MGRGARGQIILAPDGVGIATLRHAGRGVRIRFNLAGAIRMGDQTDLDDDAETMRAAG